MRGHPVRAEFRGHRQSDAAGDHVAAFPGARRERECGRFHRLGLCHRVLAVRRQQVARCRAVEQRNPELLLECRKAPRDRGVVDAQPPGGR